MNTTSTRIVSLQSGQAFAGEQARATRLYLVEGEVLLGAPARWLGGSMVITPARRVVAPAVLDAQQVASLTAATPARLLVEQKMSVLDRIAAAFAMASAARSASRHASRPAATST